MKVREKYYKTSKYQGRAHHLSEKVKNRSKWYKTWLANIGSSKMANTHFDIVKIDWVKTSKFKRWHFNNIARNGRFRNIEIFNFPNCIKYIIFQSRFGLVSEQSNEKGTQHPKTQHSQTTWRLYKERLLTDMSCIRSTWCQEYVLFPYNEPHKPVNWTSSDFWPGRSGRPGSINTTSSIQRVTSIRHTRIVDCK